MFSFPEYADPGVSTFGLGHVKIEVSSAVLGFNASQDCLVRERNLSLTDPSKSVVESIFLSPLWVTFLFSNALCFTLSTLQC